MKLLVLGGFLGSGKTTILTSLAKYIIGDGPVEGYKVMVIKNEIGEVEVDDKLLRAGGLQVQDMLAGCACCTLAGQLGPTIKQVQEDYDPEYIIFEATGVANPGSIVSTVHDYMPDLPIRSCALVDAKRWPRIKPAIGYLVQSQLEDVDTIVVNKIDLVDEEAADQVVSDVHEMNPEPQIFKVSALNGVDDSVWQAVLGE